MEFPAILILVVIWLLIGLPQSKVGKTAKQQQAAGKKPGAAKPDAKAPQQPANSTVTSHADWSLLGVKPNTEM